MVFAYWELVANFLLSIAWPILIGVLGWRFGPGFLLVIRSLANRAEHFRSRWGNISFRDQLDETKAIALSRGKGKRVDLGKETGQQPPQDEWLIPPRAPKIDYADYLDMAPVKRILFEYSRLQVVVTMQAKRLGALSDDTPQHKRSIPELTLALSNAGVIENALAETIYRLANMGNRLERGSATPRDLFDQSLATDYGDLVNVVVQELSDANPRKPNRD